MPLGLLTTTSPNLMSAVELGTPPPIPTMKPNLIEVNVESSLVATIAAEAVPATSAGRQARIILRGPILPKV